MSALFWRGGTLYPRGSLARPNAAGASLTAPASIANPSFEAGAASWSLTGAMAIVSDPGNAFAGTFVARLTGPAANSSAVSTTQFPVTPGQSVSASCMIRVAGAVDQVGGSVAIIWYTAANASISSVEGNQVNVLTQGYAISQATGIAPAGATYCRIAGFAFALQTGTVRFDQFSITYAAPLAASQMVYRAVQADIGTSAAVEPAWPQTAGQTVVDGTVTWEAVLANVVAWVAEPILRTGNVEPVWPTTPNSVIDDNGILWRCVGRQIKDARAPRTKVVAIAAGKVFAADGDVIRYCATGNPLDWTSPEDAGFLPFGLQQNGANQIDVLNLYRSNLVAFNASTFQMWQVDPDPEQMALLDTMEGIGSTAQQAAQPVANDLFFLTPLGVRTVGIAAGSTNLQAGDVGMPIDPLIQQKVTGGVGFSLSCYYPAAGQYWLILR